MKAHASEKEFHDIEFLGKFLNNKIKSKGLVKIPSSLRDTEKSKFNLSKFVEEIDIFSKIKHHMFSNISFQNVNIKFITMDSSKLFLQNQSYQ